MCVLRYTREINELKLTQRFRGKSHSKKKVAKADRRMHGRKIRILAGDRGYRGQQMSGDTKILIPDVPKASDSAYAKSKKHKLFTKRAGIEPAIGHCKSDHRLGRNFYKGLFGDSINVMLAAAGFNLKRVMKALLCLIRRWVTWLITTDDDEFDTSKYLACVCA